MFFRPSGSLPRVKPFFTYRSIRSRTALSTSIVSATKNTVALPVRNQPSFRVHRLDSSSLRPVSNSTHNVDCISYQEYDCSTSTESAILPGLPTKFIVFASGLKQPSQLRFEAATKNTVAPPLQNQPSFRVYRLNSSSLRPVSNSPHNFGLKQLPKIR